MHKPRGGIALKPWGAASTASAVPYVRRDFHAVGILCSLSAEYDPFRVGAALRLLRKLGQAAPVHILLRWDNAHTKTGALYTPVPETETTPLAETPSRNHQSEIK